jgi:phytoene dehydrogenase-like protein
MEQYDVIIIGNGLGSLFTATYLSKRLRNVAVFKQSKEKRDYSYSKRFRDSENSHFRFEFYHRDIGGVKNSNLFMRYLSRCGLEHTFEYYENPKSAIIYSDKHVVSRPNSFNDFLIYLVRYYPKYRDNIHKLFDDLMAHYRDFQVQKIARLNNQEYTLNSAMIEYLDQSLDQVLRKYFNNEKLIQEFVFVHDSIGLNPKEINAYYYFIKWFETFIDGSHYIKTPYHSVIQKMSNEISKTKEKVFVDRTVQQIVFEDNHIHHIIDDKGVAVYAKHFVIDMRVDDFIDSYVPERDDLRTSFNNLYPGIKKEMYRNKLYIGLNIPPEEAGITENTYFFAETENTNVRFLSLINYKGIDPKSCVDGKTAILIEFIDDNSPRKTKINEVIDKFVSYFPNAKNHITLKRIGTKESFFGGLASSSYWKDKKINDLFSYDDYSEINPFSNAYFIGSWVKPESGLTGCLQTGVEYGDIIDDYIYHGDDDDYFIPHDDLMNIISHQFIPNALGKEEKNIQFFVGKDSYFIRTKGPIHRLYKGVSDISDIIIVATNETLYDLSVGNTTLQKALHNGTLEYVGDKVFLQEIMEAFDMGIEITKPTTYTYVQGKWGNKIFLFEMGVILLSNLLSNYHPYIYLAPITLSVFGIGVYVKHRLLKHVSLFEYIVLGVYAILSILSIFIPEINAIKDDKYTLGFFTSYLLLTWLINRPIAFTYIRHDYRTDYTRTKLFTKMSGGLSFVWVVTFIVILSMDFRLIQSYSSLGYYLVPIAMYLSLYYPSSYISGYID